MSTAQFVPIPVFTAPKMPSQALYGGQALPVSTPPAAGPASKMGTVGETGMVSVESDIACNMTIYLRSPGSGNWVQPGISTEYTKAFTSKNLQYFTAYPGTDFYLTSDTANTHAWWNS